MTDEPKEDSRLRPWLACLSGPTGAKGHAFMREDRRTARAAKRYAWECSKCGTRWSRGTPEGMTEFRWVKREGPMRYERKP